ncbi:MAG: ATP-dependent metallopeptidase FtsH/Yme1/Tma family protein, partial [Burkholderia sp.]|nr:ATP-dependent metallopeptidase FtsH/Yme1/Tma family protein [Burkholderia sp.]
MNRKYSQVAIWAAVVFVLVMVFGQFGGNEGSVRGTPTTYSEMLSQIQSKNIKEATIEGEKIIALTNNGTVLTANTTSLDRGLIGDLRDNDVKFDIKA